MDRSSLRMWWETAGRLMSGGLAAPEKSPGSMAFTRVSRCIGRATRAYTPACVEFGLFPACSVAGDLSATPVVADGRGGFTTRLRR